MNKDRPEATPSPDKPQADEATGGGGSRPSFVSVEGDPVVTQGSTPAGEPFNRVKYMREYMRKYRTRKRLEKAEKDDG